MHTSDKKRSISCVGLMKFRRSWSPHLRVEVKGGKIGRVDFARNQEEGLGTLHSNLSCEFLFKYKVVLSFQRCYCHATKP